MNSNENNLLVPSVAPANRGAGWLFDGFSIVKKNWPIWIGVTIVFILLSLIISIIPFINFLYNLILSVLFHLILPVLFGGLMLGCRQQDQGGEFRFNHLFAGFSKNLEQYILLGVLSIVGLTFIVIITIICLFFIFGGTELLTTFQSANVESLAENYIYVVLIILIGTLLLTTLSMPLIMVLWFAPALVALENQTAINAMKYSFIACVKNAVPYLVYGLLSMVFAILATLPLGLGWLILFPVTIASIYVAYRDIFKNGSSAKSVD